MYKKILKPFALVAVAVMVAFSGMVLVGCKPTTVQRIEKEFNVELPKGMVVLFDHYKRNGEWRQQYTVFQLKEVPNTEFLNRYSFVAKENLYLESSEWVQLHESNSTQRFRTTIGVPEEYLPDWSGDYYLSFDRYMFYFPTTLRLIFG